ncbi:MAG: hypothetical protein DLM60_19915, partial [Pseudonocardiales bacterium]
VTIVTSQTFDGREKSLLRAAATDLLPSSVLQRVKSPYPSTEDPLYASALQQQAKELLSKPEDPVFELVNRRWVDNAAAQRDPATWPRRRLVVVPSGVGYRPVLDRGAPVLWRARSHLCCVCHARKDHLVILWEFLSGRTECAELGMNNWARCRCVFAALKSGRVTIPS